MLYYIIRQLYIFTLREQKPNHKSSLKIAAAVWCLLQQSRTAILMYYDL